MSKNSSILLNEESLAAFLKESVQTIKTEGDPDVLNKYRKIFKKYIPFTLRSYMAAYFLKELEKAAFLKTKPYIKRTNSHYGERQRSFFGDRSGHADHPVLNDDEASSIFVSVGRSRRVFPRDIITLFIQNADITRDRIGDIRILENYSFVQVMREDADEIIQKLHNMPYRGRPLSVSYARKPEDGGSTAETMTESSETLNDAAE